MLGRISAASRRGVATVIGLPAQTSRSADALSDEGRRLRSDILLAHEERSNRRPPVPPGIGFDITLVVEKYIKPGMLFADAERLLKAAGLTVSARPGIDGWRRPANGRRPRHDNHAFVATSFGMFGRTRFERMIMRIVKDRTAQVFVSLNPVRPGNDGIVDRVNASIALTSF